MSVVRPRIASRRPSRIRASVVASTEAVASSRMRMRGSIDERARDRDPLPLAARERDAALADHRVVAVRQLLDELVRLREPRGALDVLVGRVRRAEGDVLAHASPRRGTGPARRSPIVAAQRRERHVAHVGAVDAARAGRDVVEARHERGERRLARAGVADQRDRRARARRRGRCPSSTGRPSRVAERRRRRSAMPPVARRAASRASGRSATSSGSSRTSKIRSPDAVARCAWPIHMPSMRSGMTSMSTRG